jgi:hypothetical protein
MSSAPKPPGISRIRLSAYAFIALRRAMRECSRASAPARNFLDSFAVLEFVPDRQPAHLRQGKVCDSPSARGTSGDLRDSA